MSRSVESNFGKTVYGHSRQFCLKPMHRACVVFARENSARAFIAEKMKKRREKKNKKRLKFDVVPAKLPHSRTCLGARNASERNSRFDRSYRTREVDCQQRTPVGFPRKPTRIRGHIQRQTLAKNSAVSGEDS